MFLCSIWPSSFNAVRVSGVKERIDCTPGRVVIYVRTGGAVAQFQAGAMEYIDFISYRPDLTGEIRCGPRTPADHVYVTWRSAPSTPRGGMFPGIIAIEFLGG